MASIGPQARKAQRLSSSQELHGRPDLQSLYEGEHCDEERGHCSTSRMLYYARTEAIQRMPANIRGEPKGTKALPLLCMSDFTIGRAPTEQTFRSIIATQCKANYKNTNTITMSRAFCEVDRVLPHLLVAHVKDFESRPRAANKNV